jgi:hypothetical protein
VICPLEVAAMLGIDNSWIGKRPEVERTMKLQDMILKATAKTINWLAAAEFSVCNRTTRRKGYQKFGCTGLMDRRKGKQSSHRVPMRQPAALPGGQVDLNIRHFHEKRRDEYRIEVSCVWIQLALQGGRPVTKRRKRVPTGADGRSAPCRAYF